ncbi:MAG: DUF89 family protein [Lentisphaeria bacterium]|nr:DUF89 family protein [Lentisphaeria bacterium]
MAIPFECYDCILGSLSGLVRRATDDIALQHKLMKEFLRAVADADEEATPPEFAAFFHRRVKELSGVEDFYREEKERSTELGLKLLPELQKIVQNSADPFETAVRFVMGGNIIDYGANPDFDLDTAEKAICEVSDMPLDKTAVVRLKNAMDDAENILYMLDNCGEAVIDHLLIGNYKEKITIGVRGEAILNDMTPQEAEASGYGGFPLIHTGDMAPGVSLRNSSPKFLQALRKFDLIIAKGQGNYETLCELDRPIFHLLRIKCPVIAERTGGTLGSLYIEGRNINAASR